VKPNPLLLFKGGEFKRQVNIMIIPISYIEIKTTNSMFLFLREGGFKYGRVKHFEHALCHFYLKTIELRLERSKKGQFFSQLEKV